jgi:hypothetical protein
MTDTDKWIESARVSLDELEKEVKRLNLRLVEADCLTDTLQTIADNQAAEVKRLRMIVARLEDARIESASMYDRPKLFQAVREIYEQRLQDIYQEKREEE